MAWIRRLISTITAPFMRYLRMLKTKVSATRIFTKLNQKVIKTISTIFAFRPSKKEDYFSISDWLIAKKLVLLILLICCAVPLIYFTKFAEAIPTSQEVKEECKEEKEFIYDDMKLDGYTGRAIIKNKDGSILYRGDIADGLCTGKGVLYNLARKKTYEGDFVENQYTGSGIQYDSKGRVIYEGEFLNNVYEGYGILHNYKTGEYYEGNFAKGKKEGIGTLYDKEDRIIFQGTYTNDHFNGDSKRFNNDSLTYEGSYKDGLKEGEGKLYNEKGVLVYEGSFSMGKRHGQGKAYNDETGRLVYEGGYVEGKRQGQGKLYNALGKEIFEGPLYDGAVDYSAYIGATWADVQAQFKETPEMIYINDSTFLAYRDLGAILKLKLNLLEMEVGAQEALVQEIPAAEESRQAGEGNANDASDENNDSTVGNEGDESTQSKDTLPQTMMDTIVSQIDPSKVEVEKVIVLRELNRPEILDEKNKLPEEKENLIGQEDETTVVTYVTQKDEESENDTIEKGSHMTQLIPPDRFYRAPHEVYEADGVQYEIVFGDGKDANVAYYKMSEKGE